MRILLLGFLLLMFSAEAQERVEVTSLNGKNRLRFSVGSEGLQYDITHEKERVVDRSAFGLALSDGDWTAGSLRKTGERRYEVDETYSLPFGKRSTYRNRCRAVDVNLQTARGDDAVLQMRAYDDGTAFRLVLHRRGPITVVDERTQFNIASPTMYVQEWDKAYEGFYHPRLLDTLIPREVLLFPGLFQSEKNTWCLVTEAGTFDNYPGTQWRMEGAAGLHTILPQKSFTVTDSVVTPWRVFITGDLATVVESSIVDHLNPPSRIADMSWIKPGVAVFPWWADHFASSNVDVLKQYVDLAAEMGWEWIEFDVALVGTDFHTSRLWESTDWIPDFVKYAHGKGIKVYGWDELKALNTPAKRDRLFGKYKALGIDGIKIDFLDSDTLDVMRFHSEALADAAKHGLMVSFHGETAPRGLRRTWPNLLTHEAVRGAEYYTFPGWPEPDPVHNTTLPFTRNVIGSMDYTPATFTAKTRKTTDAHELALPFVFESGWMVMADAPHAYLTSPAKAILQKLEAAWDETRLLDGFPGAFCVMARRKGAEWFVAAINAGTARTVTLDLKRLGIRDAAVTVYADSDTSSGIEAKTKQIQNRKLSLPLKANGGFVFSTSIQNNNSKN